VSELAEALEEYRENKPLRYRVASNLEKPEGIAAELADVIIRVGDLAGILGFDLEDAVREKMEYNSKRSFMHGGKRV
jgi:NTP pyrophosphatase (non-canonical NTP hydrolase)